MVSFKGISYELGILIFKEDKKLDKLHELVK